MKLALSRFLCFLLVLAAPAFADPAIPGLKLKGFGLETPAGGGGEIVRVTSLEDSGPGSLREAVGKKGPRTVVFEISGTIVLKRALDIREPFLTIAGETAPAGGITLRGAGLTVRAHDIRIQHLRVRVGDDPDGPRSDLRDAVQLYGPADPRSPKGVTGAKDVVFDSCSFSWGVDELIGLQFAPENIAFYRCIFSEALRHAGHPKDRRKGKGGHSKGLLIAESCKNILVAGCLFAHNYDRNPGFVKKGAQNILFLNNVAYNSGRSRFVDIGSTDQPRWWNPESYSAQIVAAVKGNVFISGPDSQGRASAVGVTGKKLDPKSEVYVQDNTLVGIGGGEFSSDASFNPRVDEEPEWMDGLSAMPSAEVEAWVLAHAGARPDDRDAVDARIVQEVKDRKGGVIDSPKERGGWPEIPVKTAPVAAPVIGKETVPIQVHIWSENQENPLPFPLAEPGRAAQVEIFVVDVAWIRAQEANPDNLQAMVDPGERKSLAFAAWLTGVLRQRTGRTISEVFFIYKLRDGRLAIYA